LNSVEEMKVKERGRQRRWGKRAKGGDVASTMITPFDVMGRSLNDLAKFRIVLRASQRHGEAKYVLIPSRAARLTVHLDVYVPFSEPTLLAQELFNLFRRSVLRLASVTLKSAMQVVSKHLAYSNSLLRRWVVPA
jgi:hypothetical protein